MKCDSLECCSEAVAKTKDTNRSFCVECAIKIAKHFGPDTMETLEGAKFPWDYPADRTCPHCKVRYNQYLINLTGDCPSCKKPLPEYTNSWERKKVTYAEGRHD